MSEKTIAILVMFTGSVGLWMAIKYGISSTDGLLDGFTVSSTAYMDRKDDPAAEAELTVAASDRVLRARELRELSEAELSAQAGEDEVAVDEEETAQEDDVAPDDENAEEFPQSKIVEERSAINDVEVNGLTINDLDAEGLPEDENKLKDDSEDKARQAQRERADSDADMQAPAEEAEDNDSDNKRDRPKRNNGLNTTLVKKRKNSVRAVDLAFVAPNDACTPTGQEAVQTGVEFRTKSAAVKGTSLSKIDLLVSAYQNCNGGKLLIVDNPSEAEIDDNWLTERRVNEVKYYLLQRRIPKSDILIP